MYPRFLEVIAQSVLSISPAVLIAGPRQVGKSTLLMKLISQYILFDEVSIRNSAKEDPVGFIQSHTAPLCLDEIQKVPELLEAIKLSIDKSRENGAYLLSGSASLLDMKGVGDTLAGRLIKTFDLCRLEIIIGLENLLTIVAKDSISRPIAYISRKIHFNKVF